MNIGNGLKNLIMLQLVEGLNLSRDLRNDWTLAERGLKLAEECGEVAEAINAHNGRFKHKEMKEPVEGELADVMLECMDILGAAYPDKTHEELLELLSNQLANKLTKWWTILYQNKGVEKVIQS